MSFGAILRRRLILVTGKGGVGKSTVGLALAFAASNLGRRVLLCETGARGFVGRTCSGGNNHHTRFNHIPTRLSSISERARSAGGEIFVAELDAREALKDYLGVTLRVATLGRLAAENKVLARLWSATPGVDEISLLDAIFAALDDRHSGRPTGFDQVIVDLPATGHALAMLDAPRAMAQLGRLGPVGKRCHELDKRLRDGSATALCVVSRPESLPTQESIELYSRLKDEMGFPAPFIVVNGMARITYSAPEHDWLHRALATESVSCGPESKSAMWSLQAIHAGLIERHCIGVLRRRFGDHLAELPLLASCGATLVRQLGREIEQVSSTGATSADETNGTELDLGETRQPRTPSPLRGRYRDEAHGGAVDETLLSAIGDRDIILCAGPGGVGKTTTSATIGVALAQAGKRVCVLTIDPARRLADAMAVTLDNTPRKIDLAGHCAGELWAVMLDPAQTWRTLVDEIAPSKAAATALLQNPIYGYISGAFSSGVEYSAIQRLFDLHNDPRFDCIVVDTPPSKNVLDFLEAPYWVSRFLDERVLRWFLLLDPAAGTRRRIRDKVLASTGKIIEDVLGRLLGADLVSSFTEFMHVFSVVAGALKRRGEHVGELLRANETGFLVITATSRGVVEDALKLREEIQKRGTRFLGFVINRVQSPNDPKALREWLDEYFEVLARQGDEPPSDDLTERLSDSFTILQHQAELDERERRYLNEQSGWSGYNATLPRFLDGVWDLDDLALLSQWL